MSNENPLEFQDSINVSEALAEAVYSVNSDRKIINTLASSTIRLAESITYNNAPVRVPEAAEALTYATSPIHAVTAAEAITFNTALDRIVEQAEEITAYTGTTLPWYVVHLAEKFLAES
ncbi:MAG TPA: hypothetical protein VLH77_00530 [Gammaproteobacteria bacterium]|nr:hypothetical protein [Gammaproteobacteria bacterium]